MMTVTATDGRTEQSRGAGRGTERTVGRQRLLERVEVELARAQPVVLRGQPGVGKTRVLTELGRRHLGPVHLAQGSGQGPVTPCALDVPEGDQQLLVLVDDAQRLPRLDVARLHALKDQPWCRVVTTVTAQAAPDPQLGPWWQEPSWRRVPVTPLDRRATAELVSELLGGLPEPKLVHEVWRMTGGNPIAIQELLRDAQEMGSVGPGADSWRLMAPLPLRRLSALVGSRLDGLSRQAEQDLRILALASPLPIRAAATLIDRRAAKELEVRGLVCYRTGSGRRTLAIVDAVHAEVVRAGMFPEQRAAALHAVAAAFERSGVTGRRRVALAGWRLEVGGWSPEAFAEASVFVHRHGDPQLAGDLADAALAAKDTPLARHIAALAATERCAGTPVDPTTGDSPCANQQATQPTATFADGMVMAHRLAVGQGSWARAVAALSGASDHATALDAAPAARAYAAVLDALAGRITSVDARLDGLDADRATGRATDRTTDAALHSGRAAGADLVVGSDLGTDAAGELDGELVRPTTAPVLAAVAGALAGLQTGDGARVRAAAAVAEPLLSQQGGEVLLPIAEHLLRGAELMTDEERPLRERIAEAADEVDSSLRCFGSETAWWYAVEGWLRWRAGDLAVARQRLVAAVLACRDADPLRLRPWVLADLAVLAGLTGSVIEAEWRIEQLGADRLRSRAVAHRCALAAILVALVRHGHEGVGAQLLELGRCAAADGRSIDAVTAWHLVARLGGASADAQQAVAHLEALQQARGGGDSGLERAHLTAWAAQDADGLEQAARDLAAKGHTLAAAEAAQQAGQLSGEERCAALAGALRAACTDADTPALEGCREVELSPRRRDAALLAMAGHDGRTIAARLGVSVRTVENHLARVYRQVGVRGRQELIELFPPDVAPFAGSSTG